MPTPVPSLSYHDIHSQELTHRLSARIQLQKEMEEADFAMALKLQEEELLQGGPSDDTTQSPSPTAQLTSSQSMITQPISRPNSTMLPSSVSHPVISRTATVTSTNPLDKTPPSSDLKSTTNRNPLVIRSGILLKLSTARREWLPRNFFLYGNRVSCYIPK